jgi:putative pyruvate formate lyase activating enzyme
MRHCQLCARQCGADRLAARTGTCRTGPLAAVASYGPHRGEERPLVGRYGSGTIFFARCNLRCRFCQNFSLLGDEAGFEVTPEELARFMLHLQSLGCHNINLVSPSHVVPQCLEALVVAVEKGLRLPLVYNTGGYDCLQALSLLDPVVDIYMPDMKFGDNEAARRYAAAADYVEVNQAAVKEMHRQVGDLVMDRGGVAVRGLLIRHLVLPGGAAGSEQVLEFIVSELGPDTYVNIMDQYFPHHEVVGDPVLGRRLESREFAKVVARARELGLWRLDDRRR